ncbi:MAG: hypothetical protein Q8N03_08155 [Ignavibacteria bacterium]|nr:hypothetical protein [Ignavibacteria bacterium]
MKDFLIVFSSILIIAYLSSCIKFESINEPPEVKEIPDSTNYFEYYPLDIGNYWEYGDIDRSRFSVEVIGDTIIQKKLFRVLREIRFSSKMDTSFSYERIDSSLCYVFTFDPFYNSEFKLDSLAAPKGKFYEGSRFVSRGPWISYRVKCESIDTITIFNEKFETKSLQFYGATDLPSYILVKGLGLYQTFFFRAGGYILKSAIIKGKYYN